MRVLQSCISSGILILVILAVRKAAVCRHSKRLLAGLWEIAVLRLAVPFSIPVVFQIQGVWDAGKPGIAQAVQTALDRSQISQTMQMASGKPGFPQIVQMVQGFLVFVWIGIGLCLLIMYAVRYFKCFGALGEALPWECGYEGLVRECSHRRVRILVSDKIHSPLTYGILRPKIVLPRQMEGRGEEVLKCVLVHESVHIASLDNLWKCVSGILACIYWFNPLVWVLYRVFSRDLELACDERAISMLGVQSRRDYACALILMAEQNAGLLVSYSNSGKKQLEERIVAIMKYKKAKIGGTIGMAALLCTAMVVFASPKTTLVQGTETDVSTGISEENVERGKSTEMSEEAKERNASYGEQELSSLEAGEDLTDEEMESAAVEALHEENSSIAAGQKETLREDKSYGEQKLSSLEAGEDLTDEEMESAAVEALHEENSSIAAGQKETLREDKSYGEQKLSSLEAGEDLTDEEMESAAETLHLENRSLAAEQERERAQ